MADPTEYDYYYDENYTDCRYMGTEHVEGKMYLIGIFATFIAMLSIVFNTFFTVVFVKNKSIRRSSVYYFGILAVLDTVMAINYIALMSLPVYMDYYHYLPMYHLFLSYFRIVLTESSCAIFASMLLIVLATTERLLRTFQGKIILKLRRFLEGNRPLVCSFCIILAIAYKMCTYWEIDVKWKPECEEGWGQWEIIAGPLVLHERYRFWWMFITRNVLDRILPFFLLVAMNYLIIKALKKEHERHQAKQNGVRRKEGRSSVKDASRALIGIVTMYIMSQSLQVLLTFWETIDKASLLKMEVTYSYLNDTVSIMTLLSSCFRFPLYCSCNHLIYTASIDSLKNFKRICFGGSKPPKVYEPIPTPVLHPPQSSNISSEDDTTIPEVPGAIYNHQLNEWQL